MRYRAEALQLLCMCVTGCRSCVVAGRSGDDSLQGASAVGLVASVAQLDLRADGTPDPAAGAAGAPGAGASARASGTALSSARTGTGLFLAAPVAAATTASAPSGAAGA